MPKNSPKITIGADPELFAFDSLSNTPVSVHDLLPGTKHSPCKVPRGAVQVDGVAAEFNIIPATTSAVFLKSIRTVHNTLDQILKSKNSLLVLKAVPTVYFSEEYFASLPTEAKALGCEPDYNAYSGEANPKPETGKPMRTASGHIHIGWDTCDQASPDYIQNCRGLVKELDFVLYRQSLNWDRDEERMELYGKPGAFRFKSYGLEYRVLSNRWLASDETIKFVFAAAKAVTSQFLQGLTSSADYKQSSLTYSNYLKSRNLPVYEGELL